MRTRGNNGIIGQTMLPGANGAGIINVTDAAQAWLGGAWPGSTSPNVIYGPGLGNTAISNVVVTDSNYNNTFGSIAVTNSYIKIFGTGFVSNTTVLINANSVPVTNVTYVSSEELRVALPTVANNQTVQFNVTNAGAPKFTSVFTQVTVNYLIVGGGGSGVYTGAAAGAGGGAGGLLTGTQTLTAGVTYPVVVGSGAFNASPLGGEKSGNNSTALGLTAIGGGSGGRGCSNNAGTGGSGGGGGGGCSKPGGLATGSPGVGVAGTQGYPGGTGTAVGGVPAPASVRAGGGGGAGGAGTTTSGGAGYAWPFTGSTYAAGGGGSVGGGSGSPGGSSCVGGPGNSAAANNQGQASTGSGGGGGSGGARNLSGGPGVVIIATPGAFYPKISVPAGLISSGNVAVTTPAAAPGSTVITFRGSGCFSVLP